MGKLFLARVGLALTLWVEVHLIFVRIGFQHASFRSWGNERRGPATRNRDDVHRSRRALWTPDIGCHFQNHWRIQRSQLLRGYAAHP
jgi:hypothetical protein